MPQSSERRRENYRRGRQELIDQLGGACVGCGEAESLEFDHVSGQRSWVARKTARWVRLANYRREAERGEVQLLCRSCNARKQRAACLQPCLVVASGRAMVLREDW